MELGRAIKVRDSLVQRVRDAYSTARICHQPSDILSANLSAALSSGPKGTPEWAIQYARGYSAALTDSLYRDSLVFGGVVDGVFYSTHRNRPDYYEAHGIAPADYADDGRVQARGHYWADDTSKPFFISDSNESVARRAGGL